MNPYLDPAGCPAEPPPIGKMAAATRALHAALDANAPWLHPTERTIQRDLRGSPEVVAWQEAKLAFMMSGEGAWSELPHLYARYGTPGTAALIAALRELEGSRCAGSSTRAARSSPIAACRRSRSSSTRCSAPAITP